MTDWTRIRRASELPAIAAPSPKAELAGDARRYPQRFFSQGEASTQGQGLSRRQGKSVIARDGAGADIPIGKPPPSAFLTADRMWRSGERRILETAAETILRAHDFPVGYDPYSEVTWMLCGLDVWWSVQPEPSARDGEQIYCLDLFRETERWPRWSAFAWAWRVYYSMVLCFNGRRDGMLQDWQAGFDLATYLAEFELNRRFDLPLLKAHVDRDAKVRAAAATNKAKGAARSARQAEVKRLGGLKLKNAYGPNGKAWTAPSLATEILEAWEDVKDKPSAGTVAADIRSLGLLSTE